LYVFLFKSTNFYIFTFKCDNIEIMDLQKGLFIKSTSKTPEIEFTPGSIKLSGRSIPEDAVGFYQPLLKWVGQYVANPAKTTKVEFKIDYVNSGSNRFIYKIIKEFDDCYKNGNDVAVYWLYEEDDETIKNLGQDLETLFEVPFNLVLHT
jgi:hypothetical protein